MSNCTNLLCIADLEGCLDNHYGKKQHTTMCEPETFTAIGKYLGNDTGNHVAFLGDYFDQGPHMVSSINGIAGLINDHKEISELYDYILENNQFDKELRNLIIY